MQTPKSRARWVRGALIGATSAIMTVGAHTAAGAAIPGGAALVMALLACATIGTVAGCLRVEGRWTRWLATTTALGAAQFLGHAALAVTGHQHADAGVAGVDPNVALTMSMTLAHLGAAAILGAAIPAVEYLYVVCCSVLCWLRLFATAGPRPASAIRFRNGEILVVPRFFTSGLGMRAPPPPMPAAA